VLGVCAGIVALMVIFLAIVTYTASSREVDAGATLFMRQVALIVFGLSGVPAVASILFFVRYGRVRRAFNHALQQFQDEHRAGSIT
jgi:putative effector of murein hydrolase LrgA (UPF0299 family)